MKYRKLLKLYEMPYKSSSLFKAASKDDQTNRQKEYYDDAIKFWMSVNKGKQNADGSWDIDGDFDFDKLYHIKPSFQIKHKISDELYTKLSEIQYCFDQVNGVLPFKLNHVKGNFNFYSVDLTSLIGFPKIVDGNCTLGYIDGVKDLVGCPEYVGGTFSIDGAGELRSLTGAPKKIGKNFILESADYLRSLEGGPIEVGGDYVLRSNEHLTSLKGCPEKINGSFKCDFNTALRSKSIAEYGPKEVMGNFIWTDNASFDEYNNILKNIKRKCIVHGRTIVTEG